MSLASEVLKPLALAILLSFALAPVAGFIERRGVPRFLAVVLTVVIALGVLGGVGYKVGQQLTRLALNADRYETNIKAKMERLRPGESSTFDKLSKVGGEMARTLDRPPMLDPQKITPVQVVSQPDYRERLQSAVGPYLESLGVGVFVLILVLFILANRDDLSDRIVKLCGQRRVSLTTKTMEEVGQRISRYLGMFAHGEFVDRAGGRARPLGDRGGIRGPLGRPGRAAALHPVRRPGDRVRASRSCSRSPTPPIRPGGCR